MNIFLTSPCPTQCALVLDDKRVIKMALETAQLLACATNQIGVDIGYKTTHLNHPCSIWVRENKPNFKWLVEHGVALCDEYTNRFGKVHASLFIIEQAAKVVDLFPEGKLDFSFNCSGYETGCVFRDYKFCLVNKWKNLDVRPATWTKSNPPSFIKEIYVKV
jgi:hypothetical protein